VELIHEVEQGVRPQTVETMDSLVEFVKGVYGTNGAP